MKKKLLLITIILSIFLLLYHNVPKKVSKEDLNYITQLLPNYSANKSVDFKNQIQEIQTIQNTLLDFTHADSIKEGIAYSESREPKDLFEEQHGLCYDRSRTLEKIFMSMGYKTRHVSLYDKQENFGLLKTMITPQIPSHAILEVKTEKGWMIVDSNKPWLGLNSRNEPVCFEQLPLENETWKQEVSKGYNVFYSEPSYHIYGLYSRHGRFYPPYNPIPDYNLRELLYNF